MLKKMGNNDKNNEMHWEFNKEMRIKLNDKNIYSSFVLLTHPLFTPWPTFLGALKSSTSSSSSFTHCG
jgi:hypothetical protein